MTNVNHVFALHGFTGSPAQWQKLLPQATCPWLTGHGPAPVLLAQYFEQEVARLALEAEALPTPRTLVGYSMGARVALGILVRRPDLFDDAVLIGANAGIREETERAERLAWEQNWQRLLEDHGLAAFVDAWQNLPLFSTQRALEPARRQEQDAMRRAHTAAGLHHALGVLGLGVMPSLWDELDEIKAKVVFVAGEKDQKFVALAQEQAAAIARARVEILPGSGHNPLLETPELFLNLLP